MSLSQLRRATQPARAKRCCSGSKSCCPRTCGGCRSRSGTAEQRSYVREFLDVMSPEEAGTPALREYIVAYRSGRDAARQWDAEAKKQLYVQWPAAWADAMLKARLS